MLFQYTDFSKLFTVLKGMIGIGVPISNVEFLYFLQNYLILFVLAFIGIFPFFRNYIQTLKKGKMKNVVEWTLMIASLIFFGLSVSSIISSSFHPFIYFRF